MIDCTGERFTSDKIEKCIREHIQLFKKTPLVFIDYLQLIPTEHEFNSDKSKTDSVVLALKGIINRYKTPLLAISSLNRASYKDDVELQSFKESGSIEYTVDVAFGLQYVAKDKKKDKQTKNRSPKSMYDPEELILTVLKNRYGAKGDFSLNFFGAFNCFEEVGNTDDDFLD